MSTNYRFNVRLSKVNEAYENERLAGHYIAMGILGELHQSMCEIRDRYRWEAQERRAAARLSFKNSK